MSAADPEKATAAVTFGIRLRLLVNDTPLSDCNVTSIRGGMVIINYDCYGCLTQRCFYKTENEAGQRELGVRMKHTI